ncbi:YceI family protein [Brumimicrobium mesophilum]|uniref:YceI family protein n=1 Tax=Brumimicrobium mesophilum TaxID=392717 RepID=UPI00131D43B0|nr:YceI family protein [Brumimicrobium mesophilum]
MMKKTKFLFVALAGLMISSCAEETAETVKTEEVKEENCLYSYSAENSEFNFTAYKFLGKTGVGGTFTEINVEGGEENESDVAVIENLSFEIPVSSISTKDESRDAKIEESFFGTINTSSLTGKVVDLDENAMKATLMISMNEIDKEVVGDYTLTDGDFTFETEINVNDWQAQEGITTLNTICKELHTDYANGDTESKLWPDVTLKFSTKLKKNCN